MKGALVGLRPLSDYKFLPVKVVPIAIATPSFNPPCTKT